LFCTSLFVLACGDKEETTVGSPGNLTGPCENHLCAAGLVCKAELCVFPGNSGGESNSNSEGSDSDTSGGVTEGVTSTSGTSEPVTTTNVSTNTESGTSTGAPETTEPGTSITTDSTTTTTTETTQTATSQTTQTTDPPETTGPDTGGPECDPACSAQETCVLVDTMPTCLQFCEPLNPACGADVCVPFEDFFVCAPDASGPEGAVGDPCQYANACDAGNLCLNGEYVEGCSAQACCSAFCDLDTPTCPGTMQCAPWFEQGMAPAGFEDLGICVIA
jgi:hypothetical protein